MNNESPETTGRPVGSSELLALVHKWRASANGNIRRGYGYKAKDRHKAIQALAMAGGLRICASELEAALGIVPTWANEKVSDDAS